MTNKEPVYEIERTCLKCGKKYLIKTTAPDIKILKCFECHMGSK